MFDPAKMNGVDTTRLATFVFAALNRCGLTKPIGRYLGLRELCTSPAITHIRNFKPRSEKWFGEFHQDNKLYDKKAEILTLWFPFRYEHGRMPSLEFLPVSLDDHLPTVSACGIDNPKSDIAMLARIQHLASLNWASHLIVDRRLKRPPGWSTFRSLILVGMRPSCCRLPC